MRSARTSEAKIVRNVYANMRAEGFHVTDSTKKACAAVASGKQAAAQLIKVRVAEYAAKRK